MTTEGTIPESRLIWYVRKQPDGKGGFVKVLHAEDRNGKLPCTACGAMGQDHTDADLTLKGARP